MQRSFLKDIGSGALPTGLTAHSPARICSGRQVGGSPRDPSPVKVPFSTPDGSSDWYPCLHAKAGTASLVPVPDPDAAAFMSLAAPGSARGRIGRKRAGQCSRPGCRLYVSLTTNSGARRGRKAASRDVVISSPWKV